MNYVEFGKENSKVIILLHGGGLSWWNYKDTAESLQKNYHIILPILDGHAGSDKPFTTIENNADEIIEFIDTYYKESVLLIGGLSLGGQILLEILSRRHDICKYAIIESALVIPSELTYSMIRPAFGSCYGLIQHKWFSKLQFKSLKIKPDLFDCYYQDTCMISKENMIAFLEANSLYTLKDSIRDSNTKIYILVGENENKVMRRSARMIQQTMRESVLRVLPGLNHGEFSINHGKSYADMITEIINNKSYGE